MTQVFNPVRESLPLENHEDCVLVLAPVGRDGPLIVRALQETRIPVALCADMTMLCQEIEQGAATVLLTTEVFDMEEADGLPAVLKRQPPWSDIPILLLSMGAARDRLEERISLLGNVTVMERPLRWASLLSALRTAIRARQRQYQVRDLLTEAETARNAALRQQTYITTLNERLRQAMTETHHRVKNNLQILTAMIDVELMRGDSDLPREVLKRLAMHIHSLAAIHDLLTQASKTDVQANALGTRAVMERLLALLEQTLGRPLHILTIEDLRLPDRYVTALALIANELISNAMKYGQGKVEVCFEVRDGNAVLQIADDGPGFPDSFDPLRAAHTGLELVENLTHHDLQGWTRYANGPDAGGVVTITMPLGAA